jgi:epsilon-lactone hydrolase
MRGKLEAAWAFIVIAFRVASRRWRRGPARPGWSFLYELFGNLMKHEFATLASRSWRAQRAGWDARALPDPTQWRVRLTRETIGGVPCAVAVPRRGDVQRTLLYLHGGAYVFGSITTNRELMGRFALGAEARVVMPLYRLAPEHPFPAALEDAFAVYAALVAREGAASLGLVGDSAGGGLSVATLLRARDERLALPACAALISPWVDLDAQGGTLETNEPYDFFSPALVARWARTYLGGADPRTALASPRHADLRGLPPLLVHVGGAEMILDQVRAFAARAKDAGVDCTLEEWPEMFHDWHVFAAIFRSSRRAMDRVAAYLKERCPAAPAEEEEAA